MSRWRKVVLLLTLFLVDAFASSSESVGIGTGSLSVGGGIGLWRSKDLDEILAVHLPGGVKLLTPFMGIDGNFRYMVRDNIAVQGELGWWGDSEETWVEGEKTSEWKLTCWVFGASALYFFKPYPAKPTPIHFFKPTPKDYRPAIYVGGGLSRYGWKIEAESKDSWIMDEETSFGFHFLGGMERRLSNNIAINGELRMIIGKVDDWDMNYSGPVLSIEVRLFSR